MLWMDVYEAIGAKYHPMDKYIDCCMEAVLACRQDESDKEIQLPGPATLSARSIVWAFKLGGLV